MTSTEKEHISKLLPVMAEIAGASFSTAAIIMMVESMDDLDYSSVIQTLTNWQRTEKKFPHPSDIRAKVMPEMDSKDDAQEVAAAIIDAISRCGYTNPGRAEDLIGSLGWEVVGRMGGWKHLCETCTHDSENTLRAQIRNFAEVVSKRAKRGELDIRPQLPEPSRTSEINFSEARRKAEMQIDYIKKQDDELSIGKIINQTFDRA